MSSSDTTKQIVVAFIDSGPSRDEMFDALKYGFDPERHLRVSLTCSGGLPDNGERWNQTFDNVQILGIRYEEKSMADGRVAQIEVRVDDSTTVKGVYNFQTHSGQLWSTIESS